MAWAKWQRTGDSGTKLVLLMLADWANPGAPDGSRPLLADGRHVAWSRQVEVAEACEMSVSSVKRHERKLVELGLIRKERRFSRSGNRLSDFVIVAVDSHGARPFPAAHLVLEDPADSTRGQSDPLSPPAETTRGQIDLRSLVTLGPGVTGDPLVTVVLDSKRDLSLSGQGQAGRTGTTTSKRERSTPKPKTTGERQIDALVAEALAAHPVWSPKLCRDALVAEVDQERPLDKITTAWRLCIADPATHSPGRFKYAMHWWDTAYADARPTSTAKPCTNPECYQGRVTVIRPGKIDAAAPCPTCQPAVSA